MTGKRLFQQTLRYLEKHSTTILTCVGMAGVVGTAVLAVQATPKALALIEEEEYRIYRETGRPETEVELTTLDMVRVAWKPYIPAVAVGAGTIACIFGANFLNQKQINSLTSAYILLEQSFKEYKNKMTQIYGEDADWKVRSGIVADKYDEEDIPSPLGEKVLFYEEHYGKFFERTMLEMKDAEYELNKEFCLNGEVSLAMFYEFLGLDWIPQGEVLGWTQADAFDFYNYCWIEIEHELTKMEDGMECYIINFKCPPKVDYDIPF